MRHGLGATVFLSTPMRRRRPRVKRLGDHTYVIEDAGEPVLENPGEGADTVYTTVSYALSPFVEGLVLVEGAGAIDGSGNDQDTTFSGMRRPTPCRVWAASTCYSGARAPTRSSEERAPTRSAVEPTTMSSASDHPFGTDTITDFTPGDRIAFDHAVFASFAAVQPQMMQVGADTVIVYNGGNTLTLQNTVAAALTANDFLFY